MYKTARAFMDNLRKCTNILKVSPGNYEQFTSFVLQYYITKLDSPSNATTFLKIYKHEKITKALIFSML